MTMNILTTQQLYKKAPAIFATQPDTTVSERYGFVPTINVVDAFQNEGWYPVKALQTNVRKKDKQAIAKHMIRFRQDPDRQIHVGDSITEMVPTNSHDRSSSYQLYLGLYRLVCSNGMVTPLDEYGHIRVRHGKQVTDNIIEGSIQLASGIPNIAASVNRLQATAISLEKGYHFAQAALRLRYGNDWEYTSPIDPIELLRPRRQEDRESTLWKVFNRVQENLMKGGIRGRSSTGRRMHTRAITSVTEDIRLNKGLWQLAESFAGIDEHKELMNQSRHRLNNNSISIKETRLMA